MYYRKGVRMETLQLIGVILAAVGAINWGLVALFKFDLVATITGSSFGESNLISRIIYLLVAIGGILALTALGELG